MNPTANETKDSSMRLLPHQVALVEAFFNPASKRVILLRGDAGLGKSAALIALASHLLRERPTARVLFVASGAALRAQFVDMLRDAGTPTIPVDRYQFRELLDSATGGEIWPAGVVAVLSREFARQEDIRDALATARWDLLIVDEAHQFRGSLGRAFLRQLGEASYRVVLATLPNLELPDAFPEDDTTVLQWRRDQVVDHDGALLEAMPRPILHEADYELSSAELSLAETVGELCKTLEAGTIQQSWVARSLLRSLQSSPAALEGSLARIRESRNRAAHGTEHLLESSEEEQLEEQPGGYLDPSIMEMAATMAARALAGIEAVGGDSKLGAFVSLLRHIDVVKAPSARICVLTEYLGTLFYLVAEIESLGKNCLPYHGGMIAESRLMALARYYAGGGILTATRAAMSTAVSLREVTDLILYDVPGSEVALQQVLGRFDRFGRQTQLNVYTLVPSNGAEDPGSESLGLLRQVLGPPTSAHPSH